MCFTSCGTRTDGNVTDADTTRYALAVEEGPGHDEARTLPAAEAEYAGRHYVIQVSIAPSDSLPTVKDDYDDPYLDNAVSVKVTADGAAVCSHVFTKHDYASAASGIDLSHIILGGMTFDRIDGAGLHFHAQLNQPGSEEGGYNFNVTLRTNGTVADVTRDNSGEDVNPSFD